MCIEALDAIILSGIVEWRGREALFAPPSRNNSVKGRQQRESAVVGPLGALIIQIYPIEVTTNDRPQVHSDTTSSSYHWMSDPI